jgi:hypothetical protein
MRMLSTHHKVNITPHECSIVMCDNVLLGEKKLPSAAQKILPVDLVSFYHTNSFMIYYNITLVSLSSNISRDMHSVDERRNGNFSSLLESSMWCRLKFINSTNDDIMQKCHFWSANKIFLAFSLCSDALAVNAKWSDRKKLLRILNKENSTKELNTFPVSPDN